MKKLIVITTILVLAIGPATVLAQSGSQVLISPAFQDEITVTTEDELILAIGWGACTPGLVKAWINAAYYEWYMNGSPILSAEQALNYWGPIESRGPTTNCLIGNGNIWASSWRYSIGSLPAGDYEISLIYGTNHNMIDGGDYDGDGHMDFLGYWEHSATVHVVEP